MSPPKNKTPLKRPRVHSDVKIMAANSAPAPIVSLKRHRARLARKALAEAARRMAEAEDALLDALRVAGRRPSAPEPRKPTRAARVLPFKPVRAA